MSGNSTDVRHYYQADIKETLLFGVDTTARGLGDPAGPLSPGKYLIQAFGLSTNRCWIKVKPWVAGDSATVTAPTAPAAGAHTYVKGQLPLDADGLTWMFLNVRRGVNDRLEAIMSAGAATLAISKVGD